ncbi:MAG: sulfotransferase [Gammaproteobacteria bacterium]|nr:sulfotransferase [Gammaproteobacteria bacterium]
MKGKPDAFAKAKKKKALAALSENRLEEAVALYRQITAYSPRDAEGWFMLGVVEGRLGAVVEAEKSLHHAVEIDGNMFDAWLALGQVLEHQQKNEAALDAYRQACVLQPKKVEALESAGRVAHALKLIREAATFYNDALLAGSRNIELARYLGDFMRSLGVPAEAAKAYAFYLQHNPGDHDVRLKLGFACIDSAMPDKALEHFSYVMEHEPDNVDAAVGKSEALLHLRREKDAFESIEPIFKNTKWHIGVAVAYARTGKGDDRIAEAIERLEALAADAGRVFYERATILFELGHLYDSRDNYDRAFDCFRLANELMAPHVKVEPVEKITNNIIQRYNHVAMRQAKRSHSNSERPVFVVGMPRSGTTLVEQILAGHPDVVGGGELYDIDNIKSNIRCRLYGGASIVSSPLDLGVDVLDFAASEYLSRLQSISQDAIRVIDKMPENFLYLGAISLIFPKARVIHCQRNPVDTCLSNFFQRFNYGHAYSYDLTALADYYRQYQRLMRHWREVVNIKILDVEYESLVDDPEGVSRKMVEFIGLPWDDACLNFYESKRAIATASYGQASRPVYDRSKERWRHYEAYIGPLRQLLAEK